MKQILTTLFCITAIGGAFFGGFSFRAASSGESAVESVENYYQIQLETVLRELVSHFTNNLQKGVVNAATVLSENRDFVLSYYLDHDLTNPVVSGVASQFGGLLALDGFEVLNSKGEMVSRFGDIPGSASEDIGSQMLVDAHGAIWLGAASISGIGKEELLLRGWIKVDTARLSRFSQVTRSELLITKGGSVLLSTLSDIERVHIVAADRIIVDNSEVPVITTSLSDSLSLLSISSIKGENKL